MSVIDCPFCHESHPVGTTLCLQTQQPLAGILPTGTLVDGKYQIVGAIGAGGMAVVYRAEHVKIGRHVALKVLLPAFAAHPELVARVEREARAAGVIDHPNVVAIVDLGSTPESGPYIAMELLRGEDLATFTEQSGGRLAPVVAADICRQVLAALEAAHDKGVVHRDLKPENVFLARADDDRPVVKVLDFGISKLSAEQTGGLSSLTRTGTVMGTPQYMAPEQAAGAKQQDARVDLYACGTVLYGLLSGALPYEAENYNVLISAILNAPPAPILERAPELDPALAAIVMKAIARRPDDRYANARAMLDALVGWLDANVPAAPSWADGSTPNLLGVPGALRGKSGTSSTMPTRSRTPTPVATGALRRPAAEPPAPITGARTNPDAARDRPTGVATRIEPRPAPSPRQDAGEDLALAPTVLPTGPLSPPEARAAPPRTNDDAKPAQSRHHRGLALTLLAVAALCVGVLGVRSFAPAAWDAVARAAGVRPSAAPAASRPSVPRPVAAHAASTVPRARTASVGRALPGRATTAGTSAANSPSGRHAAAQRSAAPRRASAAGTRRTRSRATRRPRRRTP